jgi:transcription elongation regulator 1
MRKKTLDEDALKLKEEDEPEEGEGAGEGGAADLTGMAKQIDLKEIQAVLKVSLSDPPLTGCIASADHVEL